MSGSTEETTDIAEQIDNSALQRGSSSDERSHTLQPPLQVSAQVDDAGDTKNGLPRPLSSTSIPLQASTSANISPYSSLQYAPRQKSGNTNRPSQSGIRSHSSLWQQQQPVSSSNLINSDTSSPSKLSTFAVSSGHTSSPVLSTVAVEGLPRSEEQMQSNADQISAAETLAKQQLRADAEEIGVRVGSLGWALLEHIYTSPTVEWIELGELLNRGEATLLLPTSLMKSSEVTLSHAYNHIIFTTLSASNLFASSFKGKEKEIDRASLVTFKGLRAEIIDDTNPAESVLLFTSFVPREDMKFVSQLRKASNRADLFKTLSPLPSTSKQLHSRSSFRILAQASSLLLPPCLSRREPRTLQSRSSSSGALLHSEQRQVNRASATFATLFGGRRERKSSIAPPFDEIEQKAEVSENAEKGDFIQVAQPTRMIAVAVIEGEIRRSQVLKEIATNTRASIRLRLTQSNRPIPSGIIDVVCSFADMFVPPSATSTNSTKSVLSISTDTDVSRMSSNVPLLAPFLYPPDQLADIFQDFYSSTKSQLQETVEPHEVEQALQWIETVICSEVYDRICCPYTSADMFHDEALTSRIQVLDQMGINLQRLGLLLPEDDSEESISIKKGLDEIVTECGKQICSLGDKERSSPSDKLAILVSAHKTIVEGLAKMPKIDLLDEVDARSLTKEEKDVKIDEEEKKATSSTSSADLILPILIYCIAKSNPSRLASCLFYIQRFHPEALVRGEASYCLVNIQAAVAFLENVEAASLGLASDTHLVTAGEIEQKSRKPDIDGRLTSQGCQRSPLPTRMRTRVAQDVGEIAGMSNRVITGALGSGFGAFGRMMGAGTNYAMGIEASAIHTPRINGEANRRQKSVEDIRGFLSGGAASKLGSVLSKVVAMENEGKESVEVKRSRPALHGISSSSKPATDYGTESDDKRKDMININSVTTASKASITDRLASLPLLSRANTASPTPSVYQTEPVSPGMILKSGAQQSTLPSKNGSLRLNSYKASLEPSQHDSDGLRSPISPASYMDRNTLLSPLAPNSPTGRKSPFYFSAPIPASLQSPFPPLSLPPTRERPLHLVLASTGSVASVKIPLIIEQLLAHKNIRIQVISTKASSHFYNREAVLGDFKEVVTTKKKAYTVKDLAREIEKAGNDDGDGMDIIYPRLHFWSDEDEWAQWSQIGDPILHIELRRWADIVLIAPCSANTLAKINAGLCDDLLTSFLRALSPSTPTYLFPAMNTMMYMHPLTASHLAFARDVLGYHIIGPIEKKLACGDLGQGAMQEWSDIVDLVVNRYSLVLASLEK